MRNIGFFLSAEFQILDLNAVSAFSIANFVVGEDYYKVTLVSPEGGQVSSALGLTIPTAKPDESYDTAFFIGSAEPASASPNTISMVQDLSRTTRRMAASSTAAFLFAAAGLLDGRRATTHWAYAAELQRLYPHIEVEADRIHVGDGGVWTSAGMSAVLDLALALIEDDLGIGTARAVARQLVLPQRRSGAQPQISALLELEPRTDRIRKVLSHAHANLRDDLSVEELAGIANLSPRQFSRLFRDETGQSPAKAVETMRLEAARVMLDSGRLPLDIVARDVGFTDADTMRRAFVRATGEKPRTLRDHRTLPRLMPPMLPSAASMHVS